MLHRPQLRYLRTPRSVNIEWRRIRLWGSHMEAVCVMRGSRVPCCGNGGGVGCAGCVGGGTERGAGSYSDPTRSPRRDARLTRPLHIAHRRRRRNTRDTHARDRAGGQRCTGRRRLRHRRQPRRALALELPVDELAARRARSEEPAFRVDEGGAQVLCDAVLDAG
eukprot:3990102-Pleurochrysis_carterae.AAC.1